MSNQTNPSRQVVALPQGGGALSGIGEKFSPDLHTGTGNFTVPIALPPGRNGFQPELNLGYSTGNGNGPYGLGWSLSIPGVSRKTSAGVPLYNEDAERLQTGGKPDVFILSGAEDLTPISGSYPGQVVYRPRTEGLFARITHHRTTEENYWQVESKDGLVSTYGRPEQTDNDPATVSKPDDSTRIFAWKLTETKDPFGNRICYEYEADTCDRGNQLLLKSIRYVDYGDTPDRFLVHVEFAYEERPDPFSDYRAGFEIRTTRRCRAIKISTHTDDGQPHSVREYRFSYTADPCNGVSLLQQLDIIGYDDAANAYDEDGPNDNHPKQLPPLTFGYTQFAPEKRRFEVVEGRDLPTRALGAADMELVDLHGGGLPDILEMNGTVRYWRNLGHGRFDMPRPMKEAPPHALADPGVQMIDANGDGRMDLLVTSGPLAGYYPLEHGARWSPKSFQRYPNAPGFNLDDPEVKLVDLDGDGYTDILRSGSRLEAFFNDPDTTIAWQHPRFAQRQTLDAFPNVNFSDPRVRLADMTGDGLQDIVLIHDGNVEYWPNLSHNRWGRRVSMRRAPRFRDSGYELGYDTQRLLLGDVDGDGLADLVYVGYDRVLLWINQGGNGWRQEPIVINGTPPVTNMNHVRLVDLHGTGVSGVLWSSDATAPGGHRLMFLDFTGGVKPYVLREMDNHMGAVTRVEYKPSTYYFLQDQEKPATRWRTPLPFPVQVVARVEVIDAVSQGKLTTEYRYHHGYWDGAEREFRGFGMVEQLDTESAADYNAAGLHGNGVAFKKVEQQFSQPTLTKTWFHQGPVGEELGNWQEVDYTHEYWPEDPQILGHTEQVNDFLRSYNDRGPGAMPSPGNRRIKRDALRTLRGSILRTELYALDGSERQDRPYTVTEYAYDLKEIGVPAGASDRKGIFFPHPVAQRTAQWERGNDPMTQFAFTGDYDEYGQPRRQSAIALPRLRRHQQGITGAVVGPVQPDETRVLATHSRTEYAGPPSAGPYIHDRVAQARTYELASPPMGPDDPADTIEQALRKQHTEAVRIDALFGDAANGLLIGHQRHYYDELTVVGQIGIHGALTRSAALVFTADHLQAAYGDERRPSYLGGLAPLPSNASANFGAGIGYRQENGGYYADTLRQQLSPRGLPLVMWDALGHATTITYDGYHLMPIQVTDAKGLSITAVYNMRLLQPARMTEPNGASTHVRYNPIGLPAKQFVVGLDPRGNETLGGTEDKPEITFVYDFRHFERTGRPVFVHTIRRIHHASDNISDNTIQSREYSDGFGRLIQTRAQAEDCVFGELGGEVGLPDQPGSAPTAAVARQQADSVVVSGWQRFDNKGQVIEKYEPFFSTGWDFQVEAEAVKGQHATLFYDPRGQVIRTLNPDGSQQRVIFGRPRQPDQLGLSPAGLASHDVPDSFTPTSWESYTYDANDLAALTHQGQATAPQQHHFTPASVVLDGMGRAMCAVARNDRSSDQWHITRSTYDIRGNLLTVIDALGRIAFSYYYDLLDRGLCVDSIDVGRRTSILDALGNLIEYRDSKGSLALRSYDELNRPKELWARNDSTSAFTLRERIQYGDEGTQALARQHNALGRPVKHYDEAGWLVMPEYDFKGNLLEKSRRTIADQALANGWQADWSAVDAEDALEDIAHQTSSRYDALNRPTEVTYPQDVDDQRKKLIPRYNRAGALESVRLGDDEYVQQIAYNAKGRRVLIAYGNGIMTRHAYDEQTFRLIRLRTERFAHTEDGTAGTRTWSGNGQLLQDFTYGYDLAGNITAIDERLGNCGIAGSAHGRDRLLRELTYDPIYRLLSATGRADENIGQPRPFADDPRAGFYAGGAPMHNQNNAPDLTEDYTETFEYDPAGNMLRLHYQANSGQWARRFGMAGQTPEQWAGANSNRLTSLVNGSDTSNYQFDPNGNLTQQNTEKHHTWDHADRMVGFRVQPDGSSSASIQARYLYGADGMRVKKWVRNQQGQVHTSTYIDGLFEHHRWQKDGGGQNNALHVMDDQSRIAMVRVGGRHPDDGGERVQYHLGDHLGSSHLVVGGDGADGRTFINREEYFAYGETSFGSFGRKRYRYSGKERDEESGLYYYGARYLAPWLARWVSCDPIGAVDGPNLFLFTSGNPIRFLDLDGTTSSSSEQLFQEELSRNDRLGHDYIDASIQAQRAREKLNNLLDRLDENTPRHQLLEAQARLQRTETVEKGFKGLLDESDAKLNDIAMKEKDKSISRRMDIQRQKNSENRIRRLDRNAKSLRSLDNLEKNLAKEVANSGGRFAKLFRFMSTAGRLYGFVGNVLGSWEEGKEIIALYYPALLPEGTLIELHQPSTLHPLFLESSGYFIEIADGKAIFRTEAGEIVTQEEVTGALEQARERAIDASMQDLYPSYSSGI
jgi:RHS repeat-associated protein